MGCAASRIVRILPSKCKNNAKLRKQGMLFVRSFAQNLLGGEGVKALKHVGCGLRLARSGRRGSLDRRPSPARQAGDPGAGPAQKRLWPGASEGWMGLLHVLGCLHPGRGALKC